MRLGGIMFQLQKQVNIPSLQLDCNNLDVSFVYLTSEMNDEFLLFAWKTNLTFFMTKQL